MYEKILKKIEIVHFLRIISETIIYNEIAKSTPAEYFI